MNSEGQSFWSIWLRYKTPFRRKTLTYLLIGAKTPCGRNLYGANKIVLYLCMSYMHRIGLNQNFHATVQLTKPMICFSDIPKVVLNCGVVFSTSLVDRVISCCSIADPCNGANCILSNIIRYLFILSYVLCCYKVSVDTCYNVIIGFTQTTLVMCTWLCDQLLQC